jgi:hypothetical protein
MATVEEMPVQTDGRSSEELKERAREQREPAKMFRRENRVLAEFVASGSSVEALGGAAAVVLGILGLSGVFPLYLAPIAVIAVGGALLLEGAAIASRFGGLLSALTDGRTGEISLAGGVSTGFIAGATGIVLGILSLLGLYPAVLAPIAIIVFGGALVLGAGMEARLTHLEAVHAGAHEIAQEVTREAVLVATGTQVLVGLGIVTLGIIALSGVFPIVLTLVALLALGGSILLSGTALASRMLTVLR